MGAKFKSKKIKEWKKKKIKICLLKLLKPLKCTPLSYTHSGLIRNGPIRITSEILGFFKKSLVKLWKLRNGEITLKIFKKWITFLS